MHRSFAAAFFCIVFVVTAGLSTIGSARDVYVNNIAGDNQRNGGSPRSEGSSSGPVRTIARALRIAGPGDRVILVDTGEPYRESITLQGRRNSGVTSQPFFFVGNGAILDGSEAFPDDEWQHYRGNVFRAIATGRFYLLYESGKPLARREVTRSRVPKLEPLEWCKSGHYVYFRVEDGKLPVDYDLSFTDKEVGITLYQVQHVVISDLIVQGFRLDGVNAHDGVFSTRFVGVTARGNGRSGVSIGGASRVGVEACVLGDNGTAQLRTEGRCRVRLVANELLENTAPAVVRDGGIIDLVK